MSESLDPAAQDPTAPLTFDELLIRCMGELDFARKMIRDFVSSTEVLFDEIDSQLDQNNVCDAITTVHRLKGTAATVAAKPLLESLVYIEKLLRADVDDAEFQENAESIEKLLKVSREQLNAVHEYAVAELY